VRVTRSDLGIAVGGASAGRGAWLCRGADGEELVDAACLEAAVSRRAFARAWKRDVDAGDEQAIRELVGWHADGHGHPDAH
jgi:predicted RNA-binding protein YlxR (DUF448 family)